MTLVWALAWRNLWRNTRRTLLSAGAVAFMVFMLIFVVSMQLGSYDTMVDHAASVMHGHAQVQRTEYVDEPRVRYVLEDAEALAANLRANSSIRSATARAMSTALASKEESTFGAMVVGVDPANEGKVSWLPGAVTAGRYLSVSAPGAEALPEAVIGEGLAKNLGLSLGDEIVSAGCDPGRWHGRACCRCGRAYFIRPTAPGPGHRARPAWVVSAGVRNGQRCPLGSGNVRQLYRREVRLSAAEKCHSKYPGRDF